MGNDGADKSVDVALAEYNALRGVMVARMTAQAALVGIALTAFGVILGLVFAKNGDPRLLLAVPPLASLVSLLHAGMTYHIIKTGRYIRNELWPFLRRYTATDAPSWESYKEELRHKDFVLARAVLVDFAPTTIFLIASVAASVVLTLDYAGVRPTPKHPVTVADGLLVMSWALTVLTAIAPAVAFLACPTEAPEYWADIRAAARKWFRAHLRPSQGEQPAEHTGNRSQSG